MDYLCESAEFELRLRALDMRRCASANGGGGGADNNGCGRQVPPEKAGAGDGGGPESRALPEDPRTGKAASLPNMTNVEENESDVAQENDEPEERRCNSDSQQYSSELFPRCFEHSRSPSPFQVKLCEKAEVQNVEVDKENEEEDEEDLGAKFVEEALRLPSSSSSSSSSDEGNSAEGTMELLSKMAERRMEEQRCSLPPRPPKNPPHQFLSRRSSSFNEKHLVFCSC